MNVLDMINNALQPQENVAGTVGQVLGGGDNNGRYVRRIPFALDVIADAVAKYKYAPPAATLATLKKNHVAAKACVAYMDQHDSSRVTAEHTKRQKEATAALIAGKEFTASTHGMIRDEFTAKYLIGYDAALSFTAQSVQLVRGIYKDVATLLDNNAQELADTHGGLVLAIAAGAAIGGLDRIYKAQAEYLRLRANKLMATPRFDYKKALHAAGINLD